MGRVEREKVTTSQRYRPTDRINDAAVPDVVFGGLGDFAEEDASGEEKGGSKYSGSPKPLYLLGPRPLFHQAG